MWQIYLPMIFGTFAFVLILVWYWQFNRRIEPHLRAMVARRFNVEISRGVHWRARDQRGKGCQLVFWEFLIIFVIGACVPLLILVVTFWVLSAIFG